MKRLVKPISLILAIAYLFLIPFSASAVTGSTNASTNALLNKWKGYGLVDSSVTDRNLNDTVQKIDFITFVNGIMKPTKKADIGFSDVPADSWYGLEIAKAVASGYVENKDKTKYNPFSGITRLDAAIITAHVFGLELSDSNIKNKITDAEKLDAGQLTDFAAVIEKGGLSETSKGRYAPSGVLKLIDALKMLDACAGKLVTKAGTISGNVTGNMLINTGSVILKNMIVSGDLIIGDGVANGDVSLENVTVKGKLVVRGGGPNSVTLTNSRVNQNMVVEKNAGDVHIKLNGTSEITQTYLKSGCFLEETGLSSGKGFVDIAARQSPADNQTATLKGDFNNIESSGNVNVKLEGNVKNVDISKDANALFSISNGSANTITTGASKSSMEIVSSTVTMFVVNTGAKGNKIEVNGTSTITNMNLKEITTLNIRRGTIETLTLENTATGSFVTNSGYIEKLYVNSPSTINGDGKIELAYVNENNVTMGLRPEGVIIAEGKTTSINGLITSPSKSTITFTSVPGEINVQEGETKIIAVGVDPATSSLAYISSDNNIATVSGKGEVKGISLGSTRVYITAQLQGYTPNTAEVKVNVTSGNVTAAGSLQISPASGEAGTKENITLTYTPGDDMTNGTLMIKLPESGFLVNESDTVSIKGSADTALAKSQRPNALTIMLTDLNLESGKDTVVIKLNNKVIPTGGTYEFKATADADGSGPKTDTAGQEKAVFTSNSLKVLLPGTNYSDPEYGSEGGTTKISKLSTAGITTGAEKWLIKVQDGALSPIPAFNDELPVSSTEYRTYTAGQNIAVSKDQYLILAAVDSSNKVKAYASIKINESSIRPGDAGTIILGKNYNTPVPGIQALTTRINGLSLSGISGAEIWMVKVQNNAETSLFVDHELPDGVQYTGGDDITAAVNQHIVLAAAASDGKVRAYADIKVTEDMVSKAAGALIPGTNYSTPEYGSAEGTTAVKTLSNGGTGGFSTVNKWMIARTNKKAVVPSLDASPAEYEKYTKDADGTPHAFVEYTADTDITISEGQHILLIGVQTAGTTNKIKAYADLTIDAAQIRQSNVIEIPDINFGAPVMGATAGTTRFPDLNFNVNTSGPTISTEAVKYMYAVQNTALAVPQLNSKLSGSKDCAAMQDIKVSDGQFLVLLATDADGRIKAYKNIQINGSQIRPGDALKLIAPNDYVLPSPGSADGTTKIILSSSNIPGWTADSRWKYKLQNSAFEVPYKGSVIDNVLSYTSGADIPVTVGQHILIIAVDSEGSGKTLAYTDEAINASQIKQPNAGTLVSSVDVAEGSTYNYSVPEPGQSGGTTRITTLNTFGIQGATKWLYRIMDASATVPVPEYNSIISGLLPYTEGSSIAITANKHFVLYAVDSYNKIKAYKDIVISQNQIRNPSATLLVTPTNYSAPAPAGTKEGATVISSLSFAGLTGQDDNWRWKYAVGNALFSAPAMDTKVSDLGVTTFALTTSTDISVSAGQYLLLLAVDSPDENSKIKGYANIYIPQSAIRPYDAGTIDSTNYNLVKGATEGSTRFDKLNSIGILDATAWMIKTQKVPFDKPAKDLAVTGSTVYSLNKDIKIEAGSHLLLLATDQLGRVKAYADIEVTKDEIMAPYAVLLTASTNYTDPVPGTAAGSTKIMLDDAGIAKDAGETIVWKYKKGSQPFNIPHLDDDGSGTEYSSYTSNQDIGPVSAGDSVLIVAVAKGASSEKIKAYKQFTLSSSQIKPAEAPALDPVKNYSVPVPGSAPGTTKIETLNKIGVVGSTDSKWQIRVVNTPETLALDSIFTTPIDYASGQNIAIKLNQYILLAVVDSSGRVKAYKNIQVTDEAQINPPLAALLTAVTNYTVPKYGSVPGTASIYVSPQGVSGCTAFAAKVVDSPVNIIANSVISYAAETSTDYTNFRSYTSGADISAAAGKYILLVAVNSDSKALAFANILIPEGGIRPGNAILLETPQNYSALVPGAGVGTAKFTELNFVGVPSAEKWLIKVQDTSPGAIMMDSSVEGAIVYEVQKDILVKEDQYLLLLAADSTGRIKGYANLLVKAENIRGTAPLLKLDTNYPAPEPGSILNTTKFAADKLVLPDGAALWKYALQDSAASTILKDSLLTGLTAYTPGKDIPVQEGKHIILVATDTGGYTKAYADITVAAANIRNVEAALSGTVISMPTGEANIVSGGRTVIVKLSYGEWQDDVLTNSTKRNTLYEGFVASGDEQAQWGKVVAALKTEGASAAQMNAAKDTITITLSEATGYNITKTQEISLTIKPELIKNAIKAAVSVNKIIISADVIAQLDGTAVTQGLGEGNIRAGGKTIIITLTNGEFTADVASDKEKRDAIFDGFKAALAPAMWSEVIAALKSAADSGVSVITRNTSKKLTIELPAVSDYDISLNDTVSLTLPYKTSTGKEILVGAIKDVAVPTQLSITADTSANLTGSIMSGTISETDIVAGNQNLIVTLTDGQWVTDIATNSTKRDALFAGLAASTETSEWAKVVAALKAAGQSAITRIDSDEIKITFPAVSNYNITSNQYVTMVIPASCIIGAKSSLIAGDTIMIERVGSVKLSGTAIGSNISESDIKLGGKTLIITLTNASWVDNITSDTDTTIKEALFDGFKADVEPAQWALVVDRLKAGSITKTSASVITITMPAVATYDLTASKQTITVTIPKEAVIGSSFDITASNSLVINSTPPVAAKVVKVSVPGTAGSYPTVYKTGDTVTINVEFDTAVDVTGIPAINLETGTTDRDAVYKTGTGTSVLTFEYKAQAGDSSDKLEYKLATSLVMQGGSIVTAGSTVKANINLPKPGSGGSLSDTSNVKIDAVAPKMLTGYPKLGTVKTETAADILVKVDEKADIYYMVLPNDGSSTTPGADDIINEVSSGTTVPDGMKGMLNTVENIDLTLPVTGLSAYTAYTVYVTALDSLQNKSAVSAFNFTTADTTAPQFNSGYPAQQEPLSDNRIDINVQSNENGEIYMIALPVGSAAPTGAQVKAAFENASDVQVAANMRAKATALSGQTITLSVTQLTVSTTYDIYAVCVDESGNVSATATIQAKTRQLSLDNVGVNLQTRQLTNTTNQMEYSFDESIWIPCTNTATSITFNDSAEMLAIFIREAINTTNIRALDILTRESESRVDKSKVNYDIGAGKITNDSDVNLQYRIAGGAWSALNAKGSAVNVEFAPGLLEARTAATVSKLPSLPVTVDNIAVQMPAPNLGHSDTENVIYGLENTYEYRIDGGAWKTGATEGTFDGTKKVEVRAKATKDKLPSASQTIQFTADTIQVVAAPESKTVTKKTVTITFEENTNKRALTVQNIKDNFLVGKWDAITGDVIQQNDWGSDFSVKWNTSGNILTIEYNTMTGATLGINDEVRITAGAGITNTSGNSGNYNAKGTLTGSFHTVPAIVSIKAENGNDSYGFGTGDRIVITFDQATKAAVFSAADLGKFLPVTGGDGSSKNSVWAAVTEDSSIVWNTDGDKLTITFDNVTDPTDPSKRLLPLVDKITVSTLLGLTDADETTEACNSSAFVSGSFTSTPEIESAVIVNAGAYGTKNAGDKIVITFDQATNRKQIKAYQLNTLLNLVDANGSTIHSWGTQKDSDITWNSEGTVLTIELSSVSGVTLKANDTLILNTQAGIKDKDGGSQASGSSTEIGGSY